MPLATDHDRDRPTLEEIGQQQLEKESLRLGQEKRLAQEERQSRERRPDKGLELDWPSLLGLGVNPSALSRRAHGGRLGQTFSHSSVDEAAPPSMLWSRRPCDQRWEARRDRRHYI